MKSALKSGIEFLEGQQQGDGGFLSLSSPRRRDFTCEEAYHSTFPASLILSSLSSLTDDALVKGIKDKLAEFLLSQKSENWSFNYWVRDSEQAKDKPYPDDLDDTFCALAALALHDKSLIDGVAMAKIVTILTALEEKEGGPYRTWLVADNADEAWRDIDLAVNSNVAYFLSLQEVELPNIAGMVEETVERGDYTSRYYPSVYPVAYFISRWYRGGKADEIRRWLMSKRYAAGSWGGPLATALAVTSLLNLGAKPGEVKKSLDHLIKSQGDDGSWLAAAFCLDPAINKKPYYAGSAALTTALCLEAISTYHLKSREAKAKPEKDKPAVQSEEDRLYKSITRKVRARLVHDIDADTALVEPAVLVMDRVLEADDSRQVVLLPLYFRSALGPKGENVSDRVIRYLSQASLYGWMAYTVYDDFLDRMGDPLLLPTANICLREMTNMFYLAAPNLPFHKRVQEVLDAIEVANAWEVQNCRFSPEAVTQGARTIEVPVYKDDLSQLANKSIGHALGPLIILGHLGFSWESKDVQGALQFFRHYLAARQLNDDAHDWEDDLNNGRINAVGALLLQHNPGASGEELRQLFWSEVAEGVCNAVLTQVSGAREALGRIGVLEDAGILERLLEPVEQSAVQALSKRKETADFLKEYQGQV